MIAHVAEGDAEDINRAVTAARKAFDEGPWPKMSAYVSTSRLSIVNLCFCFKITRNSPWFIIAGKIKDIAAHC